MRQVIARSVRHRSAKKRGADVTTIAFGEHMVGKRVPVETVLTVEHALSKLQTMSKRQVKVVECKFYGGLTTEETASVLNISTATVKRDWRLARAWLFIHLSCDV